MERKGEIGGVLKADSVRKECEASLRRLKVDVIDLYQIHWPQPEEDIEEGRGELAKLKQEGKVRWIGVSNFSPQQMERISKIAPITSLQPPYSAISPEIETEILPYCRRHNIGGNCIFAHEIRPADGRNGASGYTLSPPTISAVRRWRFKSQTDAQSRLAAFNAADWRTPWPFGGRGALAWQSTKRDDREGLKYSFKSGSCRDEKRPPACAAIAGQAVVTRMAIWAALVVVRGKHREK